MIIKIYTSKCEIEEIKLILRHFKFNTIKLKQPQKIWTNTKNQHRRTMAQTGNSDKLYGKRMFMIFSKTQQTQIFTNNR